MQRKTGSLGKFLVALFFCFIASFFGSWVFLSSGLVNTENSIQRSTTVVSSEEQVNKRVADEVSPSVVSVTTTIINSNGYYRTASQGAGTGIIISKDGYILTNKHVINGASQVSIVTNDGKIYSDVEVVGIDPLNDIAFLKAKSDKAFVPAKLADSKNVKVGQKVLAIGNALGEFQNSVTSGIISGEGRPIVAQDGTSDGESLENLFQTDTAINPGNSGGPLVNTGGEVIGINTAVAADSQGIGFAIPINATKGLIKGLMKNGEVERAYLGVMYIGITPAVAERLNLSVKQGAYLYQTNTTAVLPGGPADKAGVKNKDIIKSVNGEKISQTNGLSLVLAQYMPGEKVSLGILRGEKAINLDVTLEAYKTE